MTNPTSTPIYTPEEKAVLFFRGVKKTLGIQSTRSLVKLVAHVLRQVRAGLTSQQTLTLEQRLPDIFKLVMPRERTSYDQSTVYNHLDELADRVYEDDKRSGRYFFSSEVAALDAVVVILKKLDKYLDLFSFEILQTPLVEELKQISLEEAA